MFLAVELTKAATPSGRFCRLRDSPHTSTFSSRSCWPALDAEPPGGQAPARTEDWSAGWAWMNTASGGSVISKTMSARLPGSTMVDRSPRPGYRGDPGYRGRPPRSGGADGSGSVRGGSEQGGIGGDGYAHRVLPAICWSGRTRWSPKVRRRRAHNLHGRGQGHGSASIGQSWRTSAPRTSQVLYTAARQACCIPAATLRGQEPTTQRGERGSWRVPRPRHLKFGLRARVDDD